MNGKIMTDTVKTIRAISFEDDKANGGRTVLDIREFAAAPAIEGSHSFTALTKDAQRRQLMVELTKEVDRLLSGEATEISLILVG